MKPNGGSQHATICFSKQLSNNYLYDVQIPNSVTYNYFAAA